jgi:hypothetical protein
VSLRQQLLAHSKVARLHSLPMQHATPTPKYATETPPTVQHSSTNTHELWVSNATSIATSTQLTSCIEGQKEPLKVALVASALAAGLDVPTCANSKAELEQELLEAARRVCDFWGDSQAARAEMVADIKATPHHLRQDLLEHFLCAYGKAK